MYTVLIDAIELETNARVVLAIPLEYYNKTYPKGLVPENIIQDFWGSYRVLSVPQIKEI